MPIDTIPEIAKTFQSTSMWYANPESHRCMTYQATGEEIQNAITVVIRNFFDSRTTILPTVAPSTLRMPISFVFDSARKVMRPNIPRQVMKIASAVNTEKSFWNRFSYKCSFEKVSSWNVYVNGRSG